MGITAVASAIRPNASASRDRFRERLRACLFEPYPSVPAEFKQVLDGVWEPLLRVFSGGDYYPLDREHLGRGGPGVWAVRGRHPVYPLLDRPDIGADERRYEFTVLFNDGEDVSRIAAWLGADPPPEVLEGFRREHERYVAELARLGLSADEISGSVGGATLDNPYLLGAWKALADFYRKSAEEGLWAKCFIG